MGCIYALHFRREYMQYKDAVPEQHLIQVSFEELEADPIGTLRKIYDKFGVCNCWQQPLAINRAYDGPQGLRRWFRASLPTAKKASRTSSATSTIVAACKAEGGSGVSGSPLSAVASAVFLHAAAPATAMLISWTSWLSNATCCPPRPCQVLFQGH
eukprot:1045937-Pelagomonas_calceolata.AAC.8